MDILSIFDDIINMYAEIILTRKKPLKQWHNILLFLLKKQIKSIFFKSEIDYYFLKFFNQFCILFRFFMFQVFKQFFNFVYIMYPYFSFLNFFYIPLYQVRIYTILQPAIVIIVRNPQRITNFVL